MFEMCDFGVDHDAAAFRGVRRSAHRNSARTSAIARARNSAGDGLGMVHSLPARPELHTLAAPVVSTRMTGS